MEEWRDIKGYEGMYQVSSFGRVLSLPRQVNRSDGGINIVKGGLVSQHKNKDGYMQCKLSRDGKCKTIKVHRLVLESFSVCPGDEYEVNHIDCDRSNNDISNLEWVTHSENVNYAIKLNRHVCTRDLTGNKNPNFNNHILHEIYANNPGLAVEKLSRPGKQNGRAVPMSMSGHGLTIHFGYIGECAKWLIDHGYSKASISSLRDRISLCMKANKPYKGFLFEYADTVPS